MSLDIWMDLSNAEGGCLYTKQLMTRWDNARLSNEELGKIVNDMLDEAIHIEVAHRTYSVGFEEAAAIVRGDIANAS